MPAYYPELSSNGFEKTYLSPRMQITVIPGFNSATLIRSLTNRQTTELAIASKDPDETARVLADVFNANLPALKTVELVSGEISKNEALVSKLKLAIEANFCVQSIKLPKPFAPLAGEIALRNKATADFVESDADIESTTSSAFYGAGITVGLIALGIGLCFIPGVGALAATALAAANAAPLLIQVFLGIAAVFGLAGLQLGLTGVIDAIRCAKFKTLKAHFKSYMAEKVRLLITPNQQRNYNEFISAGNRLTALDYFGGTQLDNINSQNGNAPQELFVTGQQARFVTLILQLINRMVEAKKVTDIFSDNFENESDDVKAQRKQAFSSANKRAPIFNEEVAEIARECGYKKGRAPLVATTNNNGDYLENEEPPKPGCLSQFKALFRNDEPTTPTTTREAAADTNFLNPSAVQPT